jgi:predicted DCC family thiol-disulfide oxidoreductase YuxK
MPDTVFYDGQCGLCHRFVRFVAAVDRDGSFRFAPLGGTTFEREVPPEQRAGLPDSVVLATRDGRLLVKSAAVIYTLQRLGGTWLLAARAVSLVPSPLRDAAYDLVARLRGRLFKRPAAVCPVVPPRLRSRFEP